METSTEQISVVHQYEHQNFYDEMLDENGQIRPQYQKLVDRLNQFGLKDIFQRQVAAERSLLLTGITFNVYSSEEGTEKIFPFDIVPRIIAAEDWVKIDEGLKQRIYALNLFLEDIYNEQKILKDKVIDEEIVKSSKGYLSQCIGLTPPASIWAHITGTDLIRHSDGNYYVLEDNMRSPSGVSYVLANRATIKQTFPQLFAQLGVEPVYDYPLRLLELFESLSHRHNPSIGLYTPGVYNSAYFEHSYLAQQMGIQLIEGRDMVVRNDEVLVRTTRGFERVDVLYRRIDDTFIDPLNFNPDSLLGVPGIFDVYKKGNVVLANAPGTGVADDKVIHAFVPEMIKYHTNEDPILPNVPTFVCWKENEREHVIQNIENMVVKAANESGGYGMLVGPASTEKEREEFKTKIRAFPREYIAQPVMSLSRVPTIIGDHLEGRHVDLRPYILYGKGNTYVMPGGLTRVALKKGSLVVNSSQGGGSKDTWVLRNKNS